MLAPITTVDSQIAPRAVHWHASSSLPLVAIGVVFFLLADTGIATEAGAAAFVIAVSILKPLFSPYLLLMLANVQDAPGLSTKWNYVGFSGVSTILLLANAMIWLSELRLTSPHSTTSSAKLKTLVVLSLVVVAYGVFISAINNSVLHIEQSTERPYAIVGALMACMILAAHATIHAVSRQTAGAARMYMTASICLAHTVAIALLQIVLGQRYFRSVSSMESVEVKQQLTEATALGIPRISGHFLSPNALALSVALLFMIIAGVSTLEEFHKRRLTFLYPIIGLLVSLLTMSKAMAGFFVLTSGILLFRVFRFRPAMVLISLAVAFAVIAMLASDFGSPLVEAFRVEGSYDDRSIRGSVWDVTLENLGRREWLLGTGLSYWPQLFESSLGRSLADPHSYLLSIPGTFGVIGVLFYLLLGFMLLQKLSNHDDKWLLISFALSLIFLKDLVSVQYVFGNNPMSYLVWVNLCLIFATSNRSSASLAPNIVDHGSVESPSWNSTGAPTEGA